MRSDRHKKVKIGIGGGRRIGIICLCLSLMISAFTLGGFAVNYSEAITKEECTYSIDNKYGIWQGGASNNGETCYIGYSGMYAITMEGGNGGYTNGGGKLTVYVNLSQGDYLKFIELKGGSGVNASSIYSLAGGSATLIYLNDIPLVGAGGQGGAYYKNNNINYPDIINSYISESSVNSVINNTLFSSGGSGSILVIKRSGNEVYASGVSGNTIEGCTPASGGSLSHSGSSGSNYLDTSRATLTAMTNDGSVPSFRVEVVSYEQADTYDAIVLQSQSVEKMAKALTTIAENSKSNGSEYLPTITVCENEPFSVKCGYYDNMVSGVSSDGNITVTNELVGDGVIVISGEISTVGTYKVTINGKQFIFDVIESPNGNNVQVLLE